MAQGLFPGSDRHRRRVGDPAVASGPRRCRAGWVLSEPRLSRGEQPGNCAGVGAAGIPAPARARLHPGPEAGATLAGLWLSVSRLVPFPKLWSLSLRDGTHPGKRG